MLSQFSIIVLEKDQRSDFEELTQSLEFSCERRKDMFWTITGRREAMIYVLYCQRVGITILAQVS